MVVTKVTVKDLLNTPLFRHASVVAGKKGVNKTVEWVHVVEVTNCKDYVNGKELVLTTGAGWNNKFDAIKYLQQLIEKNVTALCIQLGAIDELLGEGFLSSPEKRVCLEVALFGLKCIPNLHETISAER